MTTIAFLDLETTGLDPQRHDIWEIGLILRQDGNPETDTEYRWLIWPDLSTADPTSLRVGGFYERTTSVLPMKPGEAHNLQWAPEEFDDEPNYPRFSDPAAVARDLARLLNGAHIVGACPSFDAAFLAHWLPRHGQAFTAHYHLLDVETLVVGHLHGLVAGTGFRRADEGEEPLELPWKSDDLSRAIGIDPTRYERHTALGDARWVRDQYNAITKETPR